MTCSGGGFSWTFAVNMSGHLIFMKVAVSSAMNVGVFVSWNDDSAPAQIQGPTQGGWLQIYMTPEGR